MNTHVCMLSNQISSLVYETKSVEVNRLQTYRNEGKRAEDCSINNNFALYEFVC